MSFMRIFCILTQQISNQRKYDSTSFWKQGGQNVKGFVFLLLFNIQVFAKREGLCATKVNYCAANLYEPEPKINIDSLSNLYLTNLLISTGIGQLVTEPWFICTDIPVKKHRLSISRALRTLRHSAAGRDVKQIHYPSMGATGGRWAFSPVYTCNPL